MRILDFLCYVAIICLFVFYIYISNQDKKMVCTEDPAALNNEQVCIVTNLLGK